MDACVHFVGLGRTIDGPDTNRVKFPRKFFRQCPYDDTDLRASPELAMFQCRYAGPACGPRYDQWREEFGRRWLAADFEPAEGDYICNEFSGTEHSFLGVCTMRGTPLHVTRRDDVPERTRDGPHLIVASATPIRTRQRGRSKDLDLGKMALMSAGEPAGVTQITGAAAGASASRARCCMRYAGISTPRSRSR